MPGLLAKDLLNMSDATSKLTLNGATLKTTMTGMHLTKGQLILDNRVTMTSAAQLQLKSTGTWAYANFGNPGDTVSLVNFSPDGRFLAAAGQNSDFANIVQVYQIASPILGLVASVSSPTFNSSGLSWSPDGRYLALGNNNQAQVYGFNGSSLILLASYNMGSAGVYVTNWSPDGRYLVIVPINNSPIQVLSFNGVSFQLVTTYYNGDEASNASWSPDGRYIAVSLYNSGSNYSYVQILSFSNLSLTSIASAAYSQSGSSISLMWVSWSHDGRYLAIVGGKNSGNEIQIYYFTGSSLALVATQSYPGSLNSVKWSPDDRYLAVCGSGAGSAGVNVMEIYSFINSVLTLVTTESYEKTLFDIDWSADGFSLASCGWIPVTGHGNVEVYTLQYGPETQAQAVSNSIVFGNSALGSSYDLNLQLLSGANVSVDGIVNYDNVNSTSIFSNDNARFILKNSNSEIRIRPSTVLGWQDSSIIANAANAGLGDYNLLSDDQNLDKIINYPGVPNTLLGSNWNIPANTVVHVSNNAVLDGNGNTINLGNNSQIFVDDTVTLTLRNVVISNNQNFANNPPIELATSRSKLVLDNARLDFMNDFYFNQGELFAYNDVNFTGTSSFIYRSTVPSYIMSGANLKFNPKTTFYFEPSTSGTTGLLAKDLLIMGDATSKLTLDHEELD